MAEIVRYLASNLTDFVRHAVSLRDGWNRRPWFRGHANSDWLLTPSLYRYGSEADVFDKETGLRIDFQRVGSQLLVERQPANHWEWYFLMQHYGTPTRLLDWTEGALTALYFAVAPRFREPANTAKSAVVWALDPIWLNYLVRGRGVFAVPERATDWLASDPLADNPTMEYPLALVPTHVARRIAVQRGQFTIFGTKANGLRDLAEHGVSQGQVHRATQGKVHRATQGKVHRATAEAAADVAPEPKNPRLVQIAIPAESVSNIYSDLALCGFRETTLFPDLEALSRELTEEWLTHPELIK